MRTANYTTNQLRAMARQGGTILVSILLLVAVSAYIATEMTYRQTMDIRRTSHIIEQDQLYEYLLAAEEFAKLGLKEDLRRDRNKQQQVDTVFKELDEWSEPRTLPIPGGYVSGEVTELHGRFNINWLMSGAGAQRDARVAQLEKLLGKLGLPTEGTAREIVQRIADWVDVDDQPMDFDGIEDSGYLLEQPAFRAANRLLLETSELLVIPGMTREDLEVLAPYIAMLPPTSKLNLNTASQELLESIDCLNSTDIITRREQEEGLKDVPPDTVLKTQGGHCDDIALVPAEYDVKSEFFLLNAEAKLGQQIMRLRSILYRSSNQQGDEAKIQVIYRKQLDPFSRV